MNRCVLGMVVLVGLGAPRLASAQALVAVRSTTATSERVGADFRESAIGAFDGDHHPGVFTRWCTADAHVKGQSVTARFVAPERIDQVSIYTAEDYAVIRKLGIETDREKLSVKTDARGVASTKLGAGETTHLTLVFEEVEPGKQPYGCITDVGLYRDGKRVTLLHAVPAAASSQLAAAIDATDAAMASCDATALGKVAAFPFAYTALQLGEIPVPSKAADAAALAKACPGREGFGRADAPRKLITLGIPGQVAVGATDDRRWIFAWQEGRWRIVRVEGVARHPLSSPPGPR